MAKESPLDPQLDRAPRPVKVEQSLGMIMVQGPRAKVGLVLIVALLLLIVGSLCWLAYEVRTAGTRVERQLARIINKPL